MQSPLCKSIICVWMTCNKALPTSDSQSKKSLSTLFGDNAIEGVYSAADCQEEFSNNPNCLWFSYFYEDNDFSPNIGFLQTDTVTPTHLCDNCLSGSMYLDCLILYQGENSPDQNTEHNLFVLDQNYYCIRFGRRKMLQMRAEIIENNKKNKKLDFSV